MEEISNIIRILEETKKAIEGKNYSEIKNLSNQTINTASLTQDPDNIAVAVLVYSLSKLLERDYYKSLSGWENFYKITIDSLTKSIISLKKNDLDKFREEFGRIRKIIEKLSGKLKEDILEVFRKAQINKASRIYEHGISMGQTAKLLGITMFELANYAGQSELSETFENKTMNQKSRIKLAMDIFK